MKPRIVYLLIALILSPLAVMAQSPEARIEAARSRVAAAGIPVSLLDSRVAEGRAKGVPMDRIAAVVEARATVLTNARQVISTTRVPSAAEVNAGADALEAGVPGAAIRAVIERAPVNDRAVAVGVLTYLHQQGIPVDRALQQVTEAIRGGPDALQNLTRNADGARPGRGVGQGQGGSAGQGRQDGAQPKGVPSSGTTPGAGKGNAGGQGKGNP